MELKTCNICIKELPIENFYLMRGKYRFPYCLKCNTEKTKLWKQNSKERAKNNSLIHRLGITLDKYNEMYEKVNGNCEICGVFKPVLCIDHDHKTKKIRGLLCNNCNHGIGKFYDNVSYLNNAVKYLNRKPH